MLGGSGLCGITPAAIGMARAVSVAPRSTGAHASAAVLPVIYHHRVFTLPDTRNGWVQIHPKAVYALLFETARDTGLRRADPRRLDGQLSMTAMLPTWGQTLVRHGHRHCLVPGGAFGTDGTWHPARST